MASTSKIVGHAQIWHSIALNTTIDIEFHNHFNICRVRAFKWQLKTQNCLPKLKQPSDAKNPTNGDKVRCNNCTYPKACVTFHLKRDIVSISKFVSKTQL